MTFKNDQFLTSTVIILRASLAVDVTTIRDKIISGYTTIAEDVKCYLEPAGSDVIFDDQVGRVAVGRFTGYFRKDIDLLENDIIKDGSAFYVVQGSANYSHLDWHIRVDLVKRNFTIAN